MNEQNYEPLQQESQSPPQKGSGLVTAGFVLGIIGICTSFIPIVNNASFVLGILALIFGAIGLVKKDLKKGRAIAALVLGILAVVITLVLQASWSAAIDESLEVLDNELAYMSGEKTNEILDQYLSVTIGELRCATDEYGFTDTELSVYLKNTGKEKKSFSVTVEAVDSEGNRIATDTIYASDLAAGQGQSFKAFEYVSSDQLEDIQNATFRVSSASFY